LSLTHFSIYNNRIYDISDSFGQLSNLTVLYLGCNKYLPSIIPKCFGQLSNLSLLDLSCNDFSCFDVSDLEGFIRLSNLTDLNLSCNALSTIPEFFSQLPNLTMLRVPFNKISVIPDYLLLLPNLTQLDLSQAKYDNGSKKIAVIPEFFGQLSSLTMLNLSENKISLIPDSFGLLSNLTWLDISYNDINFIPETFGKLSKLTWLDLSCNGLPYYEYQIIKKRPRDPILFLSGMVLARLINLSHFRIHESSLVSLTEYALENNLTYLWSCLFESNHYCGKGGYGIKLRDLPIFSIACLLSHKFTYMDYECYIELAESLSLEELL
jgi:Leucine-rich repeat (LRR) protein